MSLKQQITSDLKQAMKAGDNQRRDVLRMLDSMIKNVEIEKKKREEGLSDQEAEEVLSRAVKQRKDAVSQYEAGGRADLVEKEQKEIEIIMSYLPEQMSDAEIREEVKKVIVEMGADKSQMGQVMGAAMARLKGKADGQLVRKIVEEELK